MAKGTPITLFEHPHDTSKNVEGAFYPLGANAERETLVKEKIRDELRRKYWHFLLKTCQLSFVQLLAKNWKSIMSNPDTNFNISIHSFVYYLLLSAPRFWKT